MKILEFQNKSCVCHIRAELMSRGCASSIVLTLNEPMMTNISDIPNTYIHMHHRDTVSWYFQARMYCGRRWKDSLYIWWCNCNILSMVLLTANCMSNWAWCNVSNGILNALKYCFYCCHQVVNISLGFWRQHLIKVCTIYLYLPSAGVATVCMEGCQHACRNICSC